ncbi:MAG: rRNA pseudouridine synthase [Actinobacteria bacterium]|nr:rRNA pseudouridine synthase [Actinomycetota bacterium]MBK5227314.1 rRNA pseudouridine synthase [Actinomycetota bacterium]
MTPEAPSEGERLQKVLAKAGVGSRRAVEEMIAAGRIKVNGVKAVLGRRVDASKDVVEVDGSRVPLGADLRYYMLNKPVGVVSTADDPEGRPTVLDYVEVPDRLWPVGRLDIETEGLIILTNDGDLTHHLTHPSFEVPRTYLAEVKGSVKERTLRALARGVDLEDGGTAPAQVDLLDRMAGSALIEITIHEGRNRQVRRMFEAVGHPVVRLARTAVGPVRLGRLKPGDLRRLSPEEVRSLYRACGL